MRNHRFIGYTDSGTFIFEVSKEVFAFVTGEDVKLDWQWYQFANRENVIFGSDSIPEERYSYVRDVLDACVDDEGFQRAVDMKNRMLETDPDEYRRIMKMQEDALN